MWLDPVAPYGMSSSNNFIRNFQARPAGRLMGRLVSSNHPGWGWRVANQKVRRCFLSFSPGFGDGWRRGGWWMGWHRIGGVQSSAPSVRYGPVTEWWWWMSARSGHPSSQPVNGRKKVKGSPARQNDGGKSDEGGGKGRRRRRRR